MTKSARSIVRLDENIETASDEKQRKWVHVATSGLYEGYRGGEQPFEFTREVFEDVVNNTRLHPSFKIGADGFGDSDVIPWDFHHASERDATDGVIPFVGAPAQGWTSDFQIRPGADDRFQLWALTRFLDTAREYIKADQYRWASVALAFESTDPISGDKTGAIITSIALTNQPFIEGMNQLVASRQLSDAESVQLPHGDVGGYFTPLDAVSAIKGLFSLSETSDISEVMAEIGKIQTWIETGSTPLGVDVTGMINAMKGILNLPILSSQLEVVFEASKLVSALIEEQGSQSLPAAAADIPLMEDTHMEPLSTESAGLQAGRSPDMTLLKNMSSVLACREADEEVESAVKELVELRSELKAKLSTSKDTNKALLDATTEIVSGSEGNVQTIDALFAALGKEDTQGAIERLGELLEASKELEALKPELEQLREQAAAKLDEQAEVDVDAVLNRKGLDS